MCIVGSELALALQKMVEFANKVNGNLYTEQSASGQLWIAGRALGIGTGEVSSAVQCDEHSIARHGIASKMVAAR